MGIRLFERVEQRIGGFWWRRSPEHQPACCPGCVKSQPHLFTPNHCCSEALTHRSHPRSLSLPVSLQSRPPHFIQSDWEDPSVESHHSSAQNLLKLSRHCPREPMSLTETCGPPHPCSPSAVPQPLSTGFGTSS